MQTIDLHLQQLNHFDMPLRMLKIALPKYKITKFLGGTFPRTPVDTSASSGGLSLGELILSNTLSLHSAGSRVLEF